MSIDLTGVDLDDDYFMKYPISYIQKLRDQFNTSLKKPWTQLQNDQYDKINDEYNKRRRGEKREPPMMNDTIGILIVAVLFLLIFSIIGLLDWYRLATTQPMKLFMYDDLLNHAPGGFILDIIWMGISMIGTLFAIYYLGRSIVDIIDIMRGFYII